MHVTGPDGAALFNASPNPYLVLDRNLHIVDANRAYLAATKRELDDIVGRWAWDAFPTDPETLKQSIASFERVIRTGQADTMALLRYDIPRPEAEGGGFEERYWSIVHSPILDDAGSVAFVLQHPIDVTEPQRLREAAKADAEHKLDLLPAQSGIFSRARSVHEENLGLKAERDRFRALFEKAPGFIAVLSGPEHRFEFVNDAYKRLFGDRDFEGRPAREAFPDLAGQGFFGLLDRAYSTGERHVASRARGRFKETARAPEEERFLDFIYEPILDNVGQVVGIFVEGHDVTEQVHAEAAFRESEERYRQIVEGAEDFAIVTLDEHGIITSWNKGATRITGFSAEEALAESSAILFTPEDRAAGAPDHEMNRARSAGRAVDERWHQRRDGSRFWGSGLTMHRGGSGGGYLKIFRDRTAEHAAEADLRESEARLARALDAGELGAWELDLATGGAWRSPQHDHIFGYRKMLPEWTYEMFIEHVVPEHRADVDAKFREATSGAGRWDFECRIRRADGELRWIWVQGTVDVAADGQPQRVKGMVRDITERKRAEDRLRELNDTLEKRVREEVAAHLKTEEALRQSQKMEAIGQLTGGVAHDFNNLLTIIRSSSDVLRRLELTEEKRRRYLDAISDTADRAAKLTSQLLAFARRQALKPEVFNVGRRVEAIAEMMRTVVGPRVELVADAECETCFVEADASQFETALVNMAVNARDAMDGVGRLTVRVRPSTNVPRIRGHGEADGAFVSVSVADTGHGIAADKIGQIFEPFFTTKEVGKGTGLGLSQVYGFAKQSGGEVSVQSSVGQGTTFTLYLPRVAAPAQREAEADASVDQPDPRGHILVVEDNEQVGAFSSQLLAELGFETSWAGNADAALKLLDEDAHRYAALFSDVVMPGMSGVELAREVRRRWPHLPVVLTSGYSHVLAQEGSHGFELLHKPYSAEDLTRVLRTAIREGVHA